MRYLAIDLGDKRTGLATGDDITNLAGPVGVIELPRGPRLMKALRDAVEEHQPDAIVLGLPLNMDGTEGERVKIVRAIGDELARAVNRPVHYQDERLTSETANQQLARTGRTHKQKKQRRDALAAAAILTEFLNTRAG